MTSNSGNGSIMKTKLIIALVLVGLVHASTWAAPLGSAFTYQGQLTDSGAPATGNYDLRFLLFDAPTGGGIIAGPVTNANLAVTGGLFTATLDFGEGAFDGPARWLQIGVRTNSSDPFTPVLPRQPLTPAPYAIYALGARLTNGAIDTPQLAAGAVTRAKIASNAVDTLQLADGAVTTSKLALGAVDTPQIANGAVTALKLASNSVTGAKIADFAVDTSQLANSAVTTAKLANDAVTSAKVENSTLIPADLDLDRFNTTFWRTSGNSNTTAGTHFIGTTDDTAFDIRVGNIRAMRFRVGADPVLTYYTNAPNIIGGSSVNFISTDAVGGTIAGGGGNVGSDDYGNKVTASFGTVSGGVLNTCSGSDAMICGGYGNIASGGGALVGGVDNISSGRYATVSGGFVNRAYGDYAAVPGGQGNEATGDHSFAAGHLAQANHTHSFVWAGGATTYFPSETGNRFHVYAQQGFQVEFGGQAASGRGNEWVVIGSANTPTKPINTSSGAYLSIVGMWQNASDRNKKENFTPVNARAVLEKLVALPVSTWNYKREDASIKHLGPMAQDFKATFGLGEDDKSIGTVDADGVSMAAIQGLNQKLEEQLAEKEVRIRQLEKRLTALERLLTQTEKP
jgi:hypothetical protein